MSRVGKYPIAIPKGIQVTFENARLTLKGPLGSTELSIVPNVRLEISESSILVVPVSDAAQDRMLWGTVKANIANAVTGVTTGYKKSLEINGTGFRAAVQNTALVLNLGYSHEISYAIPAGIKITTPRPTLIVVEGIDKQAVGQVAAILIAYRPPEPYKGKGVKHEGKAIRRKEGKKK